MFSLDITETIVVPPAKDAPLDPTSSMTLDAWLAAVTSSERSRSRCLITFQFLTEAHRVDFLRTVGQRSEWDVRALLRSFLIPSGSLRSDPDFIRAAYQAERGTTVRKTEFYSRLLARVSRRTGVGPWEGLTWILDLLPDAPRKAIDIIDAYLDVHARYMPDGRLAGMGDARAIIRSKYILVGDVEGSERALQKLTPREFEVRVAALFRAMGYRTRLTPPAKDGGRDVIATKHRPGERERCLVECKHQARPVSVKDVRALLGVISDERATKGVLVTSSRFTKGSKALAKGNRRLDLIPRQALVILLNEHLGTDWPLKVDGLLAEEAAHQAPKPT
jgi:restriction system protein